MRRFALLTALAALAAIAAAAQFPVNTRIHADQPGPRSSPALYSLMTEEINYAYDRGLYAELIRNRNSANPVHWSAASGATIELTIGDITLRPGHMNDAWKYRSSDGIDFLEYLNRCEDLHMRPPVAVYAGYSLHGERVKPGPEPREVRQLFFDATRDSKTGTICLKIANTMNDAMPIHVAVSGASIAARGESITMGAGSPDDTNSILAPKKVVPIASAMDGLGADFTKTFPPCSINVLEMTPNNVR